MRPVTYNLDSAGALARLQLHRSRPSFANLLGGFYFARAGNWQVSHAMRQDWHSAESFTCSQIGARICACAEKAAVESRQETRVSKRLQAGQPIPTGTCRGSSASTRGLRRTVTSPEVCILGRNENPRSVLTLTTRAFQTFLMGAIRSVRLARI